MQIGDQVTVKASLPRVFNAVQGEVGTVTAIETRELTPGAETPVATVLFPLYGGEFGGIKQSDLQ